MGYEYSKLFEDIEKSKKSNSNYTKFYEMNNKKEEKKEEKKQESITTPKVDYSSIKVVSYGQEEKKPVVYKYNGKEFQSPSSDYTKVKTVLPKPGKTNEEKRQDFLNFEKSYAEDDKKDSYVEKGKELNSNGALNVGQRGSLWLKLAYANSTMPGGDKKYRYLTEEETETYYYLLGKEGAKKANYYLQGVDERLIQRQAEEEYEEYLQMSKGERALEDVKLMFQSGIDSNATGARQLFNMGDDSYITQTATQTTADMVRADKDGLSGFVFDLGRNTSSILPALAMNVLAPGSGLVMTGITSSGNSYMDAMESGASEHEAQMYSVTSGMSEMLTQHFLGGINGLSATKSVGKGFKEGLKAMGREGGEEYLQALIDPVIRNDILGEENPFAPFSEDKIKAFVQGGLISGGYNLAGSNITKGVNNTKGVENINPYSDIANPSTKTENKAINPYSKEVGEVKLGYRDIIKNINTLPENVRAGVDTQRSGGGGMFEVENYYKNILPIKKESGEAGEAVVARLLPGRFYGVDNIQDIKGVEIKGKEFFEKFLPRKEDVEGYVGDGEEVIYKDKHGNLNNNKEIYELYGYDKRVDEKFIQGNKIAKKELEKKAQGDIMKIRQEGNRLMDNRTIAIVPEMKLAGYFLDSTHEKGKHKARVFNSVLGYNKDNWEELAYIMLDKIQFTPYREVERTKHGIKYKMPIRILGRKQKSMIITVVFQVDNGTNVPRFITTTFDTKTIRTEEEER